MNSLERRLTIQYKSKVTELETQLAAAQKALKAYDKIDEWEYCNQCNPVNCEDCKILEDADTARNLKIKALDASVSDIENINDYNDDLVNLIHDIYIMLDIEDKFILNRDNWIEFANQELTDAIQDMKKGASSLNGKVLVGKKEIKDMIKILNEVDIELREACADFTDKLSNRVNQVIFQLEKLQEAAGGK